MADENNTDITALTVQLLSAFVSKNSVPSESLAELIKTTRAALTEDLAAPARDVAPDHVPAVSVRKSIASPDHIISLIDGKPYKTLKRHLATNGLTLSNIASATNCPNPIPWLHPIIPTRAARSPSDWAWAGRQQLGPQLPQPPPPPVQHLPPKPSLLQLLLTPTRRRQPKGLQRPRRKPLPLQRQTSAPRATKQRSRHNRASGCRSSRPKKNQRPAQ